MDKVAYYKEEIYKIAKLSDGAKGALRGARTLGITGGAVGSGIGAVSGGLKKPQEGESRLKNIGKGALKGGAIGGGVGAGLGAVAGGRMGEARLDDAIAKNRARRTALANAAKGKSVRVDDLK